MREDLVTFVGRAFAGWLESNPSEHLPVPRAGKARRPRGVATPSGAPVPAAAAAAPTPDAVPAGDRIAIGARLTRPNGDVYVARKVDGSLSDVQWILDNYKADLPILLYGAPGTGKTALMEAAFGASLLTMLGSEDTERADFEGSYVQTADGRFVWVDGVLIRAMEEGRPLFIDEVGLISPKVLSLLYSAMDGRQEIVVNGNPERGVVKAKPGFMVVAATNPDAPGVRLSEALLSRFAAQSEMGTDWSVAKRLGLSPELVAAFENLDKKRMAGELSGSPQMREALVLMRQEAVFGRTIALRNLVAASQDQDRAVVADVLSRACGIKVEGLAFR